MATVSDEDWKRMIDRAKRRGEGLEEEKFTGAEDGKVMLGGETINEKGAVDSWLMKMVVRKMNPSLVERMRGWAREGLTADEIVRRVKELKGEA